MPEREILFREAIAEAMREADPALEALREGVDRLMQHAFKFRRGNGAVDRGLGVGSAPH